MSIKSILKAIYTRCYNPFLFLGNKNIGKKVFIGKHTLITHKKYLHIGNNVRLGNNFEMRSFPEFAGQVYAPQVIIEDDCYLGDHLKILCNDTVSICKNSLIASNVLITTENHGMDIASQASYGKQPLTHASVKIEEHCWIGEKVIILPGVVIGEWSVVAAGAVVTKSVPPYTIVAGNPARPIKRYDFDLQGWTKL